MAVLRKQNEKLLFQGEFQNGHLERAFGRSENPERMLMVQEQSRTGIQNGRMTVLEKQKLCEDFLLSFSSTAKFSDRFAFPASFLHLRSHPFPLLRHLLFLPTTTEASSSVNHHACFSLRHRHLLWSSSPPFETQDFSRDSSSPIKGHRELLVATPPPNPEIHNRSSLLPNLRRLQSPSIPIATSPSACSSSSPRSFATTNLGFVRPSRAVEAIGRSSPAVAAVAGNRKRGRRLAEP